MTRSIETAAPGTEAQPECIKGLIEALETIAEGHDAGRHDGLPEDYPAHDADMMFAIARAALAKYATQQGGGA